LSPRANLIGIWDDDERRGRSFAEGISRPFFGSADDLLAGVDAVVITSENNKHAELGIMAAKKGRHILCEKPLVTNESDGRELLESARSVKLMTAFPCRFSPAYVRLKQRVKNGDIGKVLAICATNHGTCPFGWFVDAAMSGGGALMDHTVHVADLLYDLLGEEPSAVYAQTANRIYGNSWDDTAYLHLTYPSGVFATIDASWSRPGNYRTWGDVKMNVVGENGVIELDMFNQMFDAYTLENGHGVGAYGSDMDGVMVEAFLASIQNDTPVPATGEDGLRAAKVAILGYTSAGNGEPATA
jgi:predicted dehydrogenase